MLLTPRSLSKVLQLTLAVIKPDAVAHPLMLEVSSNSTVTLWCTHHRGHVTVGPPWIAIFQARPVDGQSHLDLKLKLGILRPHCHILGTVEQFLWCGSIHCPSRTMHGRGQGFCSRTLHCSNVINVIHLSQLSVGLNVMADRCTALYVSYKFTSTGYVCIESTI